MIEGMADGRTALLFKTHQALVDGSETIDLAQVLLEETNRERDIPRDEWQPRDRPSRPGLVAAGLKSNIARPVEALRIAEYNLGRITRAVPGVVSAFSADDLVMAPITALLDRPFEQFRPTDMPVLAHDVVRFIGEPIAIVIARTPHAAEDGVEAARVEYEEYEAIVSADAAMADGARRIHDGAPDNVLVDVSLVGLDSLHQSAQRRGHMSVCPTVSVGVRSE